MQVTASGGSRSRVLARLALVTMLTLAHSGVIGGNNDGLASLGWLAGEWHGFGREEGSQAPEGKAVLYWTSVTGGVLTSLFTWHVPDTGHVHHALTVFDASSGTVRGRGIHYGRDFETFEQHPWEFEISTIDRRSVTFDCVRHCRAKSVTLRLNEKGELEERWRPLKAGEPEWVVTYQPRGSDHR